MTPDPQEERSFRAALAALAVLHALPLWTTRLLPMVDIPSHLALINVLHRLDDPSLPFGRFFAIRPAFTPYLGHYWTLHLAAYAIPLETANRIFLTICAAGLPLAALALARALGRSRWPALFAIPLAFTFEFYLGFVGYLAALVLMLLALALYAARLQGRIAGRGWDLLLAAVPAACLATHVQPYTFFLAGLAVMLAVFPGRRLGAILPAVPSLLLLGWWLGPILAGASGGPALTAAVASDPFVRRAAEVGRRLLDQFTDPVDSAILAGFALLWAWGMAAAIRAGIPEGAAGDRGTAALLAAGAIGGYFMMPTHAALMQFIHHRYATLACLMMALAVPFAPGGAPRAWRRALAALCAANGIYLLVQFHRFDAEAGDFRALAEKVERGSCVAQIAPYMETGVVRETGVYSSFAGYISLWRGAIPGTSFASTRHSPLTYRRPDGSLAADWREAALPEVRGQETLIRAGALYAVHGGFYRYFLAPRARDPEELFGAGAARLVAIGASGPLALYLNPEGRCGG